ncbi:MAG: cysteine desulfurase NifS [Clostridiaceae bacterium]|nr:cysteine desulfurase NifS [Clostridiaceae bacterium]
MDKMFVYADNAATTRVDPRVRDKMLPHFCEGYGNPSSLYKLGRDAKVAIEEARKNVAAVMNAEPSEIFFTSGGTEADNFALRGMMHSRQANGKKHLITTVIEHPAILETCKSLEKEGYRVTRLPVDKHGLVDLKVLDQAICDDTLLVSVMSANNEIGTIEPIAEIGTLCRNRGVFFHTDAVQAYGHIPLDVKAMKIDLLSLSGHKINGPKGVGAIYIRSGVMPEAFVTGGGQERNRRSGTENVPGIVGLGEAARLKGLEMPEESSRVRALSQRLIEGVLKIPQTILTGHPTNRLPGNCSFAIAAIEGESLVLYLDDMGVCASTGSACSTGSLDPSHVLMGIGLSHEVAHGSLRMTLGRFTTDAEVDHILEVLPHIVDRLRAMSPVWHG